MESWNRIISVAMLGTDKRQLKKEELHPALQEYSDTAITNEAEKEEQFLQIAALHFNFRQCGYIPLNKPTATITVAEAESAPYISETAKTVLNDILQTESEGLLRYWLQQCNDAGRIVVPEKLPELLELSGHSAGIRQLVRQCAGKRGVWLSQFNPEWQKETGADSDELWETGNKEQRKDLLHRIRKENPAKGRELLQATWPKENAASKTDLIDALEVNLSSEDLPWLEELLSEKSAKLKAKVQELLQSIPESSLVQLYWKTLSPSLELKKEKKLLGLSSKEVLTINPITNVDELAYGSGVRKAENETDQALLIYDLLSGIPPSFLEKKFNLDKHNIIKAIQNSDHSTHLYTLAKAAIRFRETDWFIAISSATDLNFFSEAPQLLPRKESEEYCRKHFDSNPDEIADVIENFNGELGVELSRELLRQAAKSPYTFNKSWFAEHIHLLPLTMSKELDKYTADEQYAAVMWEKNRELISSLLHLKSETLRSFKENP